MSKVLGINAVFHDPAAALVVDGEIVAAAEEERFIRRKHGKDAVPFSTWELPVESMRWCLDHAGMSAAELDSVGYSYEPGLVPFGAEQENTTAPWEGMRTLYARRTPKVLKAVLPDVDPQRVNFVPHHVAHAFSACIAAPFPESAVLVVDGRGEAASHLAGHWTGDRLDVLATQALPHSLGFFYEGVTEHLGFRRASDEYKVMALAAYGDPDRFASAFRDAVRADVHGGFAVDPVDLGSLVPARSTGEPWSRDHADLAAAVQRRLEEVLVDLACWLHEKTRDRYLTMAGGVALNCVANGRLARETPYDDIWVQPAAGDSGTAIGAALFEASRLGDTCRPMTTAALGRMWTEEEIEELLKTAELTYERPTDLAGTVTDALEGGAVVGWFEGRSEFGPRALGHRSLLVDPRRHENLRRMNSIKGREDFRPVAPMVLSSRAQAIFEGVDPSPFMLFAHRVRPEWRDRIPAVVHIDGSARIQTVDAVDEPHIAALLQAFEQRTGVPVLVNTRFNTSGRPMVDSPRDALECFGANPIDMLVLHPFLLRARR